MRKRIKSTGFKDWDTMFYNNVLSIPVLAIASLLVEDWSAENLQRNLCVCTRPFARRLTLKLSQPGGDTQLSPFRDHGLWRCGRLHLVHHCVVHPRDEQHDLQVR